MTIRKLLYALFTLLLATSAIGAETIFYTLREHADDRIAPWNTTLERIHRHHRKMNMLIPQTYFIRANGDIGGAVDTELIQTAKKYHIKIMPLVTNTLFDANLAHQFLHDKAAQTKALNTLITQCLTNHFDGLQFDFEMIALNDRDALTAFFHDASQRLHQQGLQISFAVAPLTSSTPDSFFEKKLYATWEGAYDLKALAKFADFISVMAYDQHGSGTTPGSTANYDWVNQVVQHALTVIPANKISLGIPGYSTHWYLGADNTQTQAHTRVKMNALSYQDAMDLIKTIHEKPLFDHHAKVNYLIFSRHWLNEYLFLEDTKSFVFKYSLVKKYHLRGISYFDLGTEDPGIWEWL